MLTKQGFDDFFRDKPCFCGSGENYSECHAKKVYKHPAEINADQGKFSSRKRNCPVLENEKPCGKQVVSSHSQQRRGTLKEIAEKNHVLGFRNGPNAKHQPDGQIGFAKISAKKASTFPGLCDKHDAAIFSDIENKALVPSYRVALSLAKRCAFYEAVVHTDASLFLNWLQCVPKFNFGFDRSAFTPELENMAHYSAYNWELVNLISKIERRSSTRKLLYYVALIDAPLPFSATGCFCIENDLAGNKLQPFSEAGRKFSFAQMSILPQSNGTTLVSISSTTDKDKEASEKFVRSFLACPASALPNATLRTALEYTENVYFRESWIDGLEETQSRELVNRFNDEPYCEVGKEKPKNSLSIPLDIALSGKRVRHSYKFK